MSQGHPQNMFQSILYMKSGRIATITLNRPERLNAISPPMPGEIARAIADAEHDNDIHIIIVQGAGKAFCSGYDLQLFAEGNKKTDPYWWDPTVDYFMMKRNTDDFMSLWRCTKPTIAKIHGACVAGGSDIALCTDICIMAEDAYIGYPPARVWGIPTTMMWIHRIGAEKAKRMLFTGDLISGKEAAEIGLVLKAVPASQLDETVNSLANRIASVPKNQLMMSKMVVNGMVDQQGLPVAQQFATLFDGVARHSPEGMYFQKESQRVGFHEAVKARDSGAPIAEGVSLPRHTFAHMNSSKL